MNAVRIRKRINSDTLTLPELRPFIGKTVDIVIEEPATGTTSEEFWGYAANEHLANEELVSERYRGIRPAPGYPACPDHTEKGTLFELLHAAEIGIELTESFAMLPAASVSGLYFSHPQSQYFAVGKIDRDQTEDYARRKRMDLARVERWLAPVLAY